MDILDPLQESTRNTAAAMEQESLNSFSALDVSAPSSSSPYDLDVLPLLSNDPSCDFWQFLDFDAPPQSPTEKDYSSATTDLQTLVSAMPFMPSSGVAHSLSSFGTSDFADV